jgi:peptidoglycan/LPS O-acetylase OafA/YrhL
MQHALTPPVSKPLDRTPPASEETNKLVGLEGLRFLTALAVLVFHYRHFFFVADEPVGLVMERLPLYGALHGFYNSGVLGVWIFWCISGFIFFWKYRDSITGRAVGGWKFFTLRFSRLYPLHLVTLLVVAVLQSVYFNLHGYFFVYQHNDLPHFLAQLLMASEWGITPGLSFDGPVWSVSVEVLVYLLFFLMLRITRSWWLNVVIVAACLDAMFRGIGWQIIICLAFFYIGGLAAIARRAIGASRFAVAIEAGAWFVAAIFPPLAMYAAGDQLERLSLPLLLGYAPVLLFCLSRQVALPSVVQGAIVAAGNMTYSSYLLHFPIQLVIMLYFTLAGRAIPVYSGALLSVYVLTTLLLSYFTFRYFEAPAQSLLRGAFRRADGPSRQPFRRASSA